MYSVLLYTFLEIWHTFKQGPLGILDSIWKIHALIHIYSTYKFRVSRRGDFNNRLIDHGMKCNHGYCSAERSRLAAFQ
jgi:hypothetical protein